MRTACCTACCEPHGAVLRHRVPVYVTTTVLDPPWNRVPSNVYVPAGESASLKIQYGAEKHVAFTDFASTENSDLDSAHALIEHLSDAS